MMPISRLDRVDPSRTSGLRRRFESEMVKRFNALMSLIYTSIVTNDCFGLGTETRALQSQSVLRGLSAATRRQFAFDRSEEKARAFLGWLREQESKGILQVTLEHAGGRRVETPWTNVYIQSAYRQGISRAQTEMKRAGLPNDLSIYNIPERTAVGAALNLPIHADRVAALYTRTFEDLQAVTDAVNANTRRKLLEGLTTNLTRGIAEGKSPTQIARDMTNDIGSGLNKIGVNRARLIARTEVMRAHHQATVAEYRRADADMDVTVLVEFKTAEDDIVCEECASLDGKEFKLDKADDLLPVHPNCRCVLLPLVRSQR